MNAAPCQEGNQQTLLAALHESVLGTEREYRLTARRVYAVKLTAEGQQVLRAAEPLARRVDERVLDALPAKRRADFMGALASIVSTLERTAPAGT